MTQDWNPIGIRHRCPDGGTSLLERDDSVPVGQFAPTRCPRCGWAQHGKQTWAELQSIRDEVIATVAGR